MKHQIVSSLSSGDLVFDIGANVGDKTQWFLDAGARVVCVEPQPKMAKTLRDRYCSYSQVVVLQKGLGANRTTMKMSICSSMPALSTLAGHWKNGRFSDVVWDSEIDIDIVTLDDLVSEYGIPKYCKIDVEGYELSVVNGLSSKIGIISYEFTGEYVDHAMQVMGKLVAIGYKEFNISVGESDSYYFESWMPFYELAAIIISSAVSNRGLWGDIYAK